MSEASGKRPEPGTYGSRRELVYENQYQYVHRVEAALGGRAREFFVTDYGPRSAVVVIRGSDVLLVRQHRLFLPDLSWEIPGGRFNAGETPEEAAVRECLEETGLRCTELRPLLHFHPGLDTLYNPSYLFYATPAAGAERPFDRAEVERCAWMPLDRCIEMIAAGEIVDSISIIALLAYRLLGPGALR